MLSIKEKKEKVVCLNNGKVYASFELAAALINVTVDRLKQSSSERNYLIGCGKDPDTGEKLYWLRYSKYDPEIDYLNDKPKFEKSDDERVVCINTLEVFENEEEAIKWCGVNATSLYRSLADKGLKRSVGTHPITKEKLHWKYVWRCSFEEAKELNQQLKVKPPEKKGIICLNTLQVFSTATEAAKWCKARSSTIYSSCGEDNYKRGAGRHPKTGERLFWFNYKYYDPNRDYNLEELKKGTSIKVREEQLGKSEKVICLNTLEVFENALKASEKYGISALTIHRSTQPSRERQSAGHHPETGESLYWMLYDVYDPNTEYSFVKNPKPRKYKERAIVCLNTKKRFQSAKEAAEWAGVKEKDLVSKSIKKRFKESCGINKETNERLFWLRLQDYDPKVDYIKKYRLNVSLTRKRAPETVVCLNTGEKIESDEAAKFAGVEEKELLRTSNLSTFRQSCGIDEKTNQKLYWLRLKDYDPKVDYFAKYQFHNNRLEKHPTDSVVCLNTGEKFESYEAAGQWAKVLYISQIKMNSTLQNCIRGVGHHPETKEKLHWLREEFYKENVNYNYLIKPSK